jgi:Zn-dependent peptidase ImmA (M78 family)/transcriptional regulator with XRE-family HTH domain
MTEPGFSPQRLRFARDRRGITQTRLAKQAGFSLRSVQGWESGTSTPEAESVGRLATALQFPIEFFYGEDLDVVSPESVSFRSMAKMTATQERVALSAGSLALLLNQWIERHFELPSCKVPSIAGDMTPEGAADWLRQEWHLGEVPVRNVVHLLESRGVRVFSLAIDAREVDAFSFWRGDVPFIFLNTGKSAERSRYDAAHELGHLILHKHAAPHGQQAELEANAFASAFLMPRSSVLANAPKLATIDVLMQKKKIWNVSIMALARRLHDLNVLSDWHYHVLCKQMSIRGFRKQEPDGSRRETSQILEKVMTALRADGITKDLIATDLGISPREIDELVFGLALTGIPGGGKRPRSKDDKKPRLTVV